MPRPFCCSWRRCAGGLPRRFDAGPARTDGVVDLEPEQWHRVPDPALPKRGEAAKRAIVDNRASLFASGPLC